MYRLRVHVCIHTYVYTYAHPFMYVLCIHMYVHVCTYMYAYANTHTHSCRSQISLSTTWREKMEMKERKAALRGVWKRSKYTFIYIWIRDLIRQKRSKSDMTDKRKDSTFCEKTSTNNILQFSNDLLRDFKLDFRKIASEIQCKIAIFVGNPRQKLCWKYNIKSLATNLEFLQGV